MHTPPPSLSCLSRRAIKVKLVMTTSPTERSRKVSLKQSTCGGFSARWIRASICTTLYRKPRMLACHITHEVLEKTSSVAEHSSLQNCCRSPGACHLRYLYPMASMDRLPLRCRRNIPGPGFFASPTRSTSRKAPSSTCRRIRRCRSQC